MIGRTIRHGSVLAVLAAACMLMTVPSLAQNRGVYPLGMTAINSGVMPESTFTYSNQFLLYTRDQVKDNEGRTLPVTGNHAVILDMNTITWVSQERILGARYGASRHDPPRNAVVDRTLRSIIGNEFRRLAADREPLVLLCYKMLTRIQITPPAVS